MVVLRLPFPSPNHNLKIEDYVIQGLEERFPYSSV